ncbi:MAG: leucine-rich repeat domain-containing protein [Treponemataceae bacterium]|nr:leucine-rich repeat domain-containing protein [Treponemataceae bacterium]
MKKTTWLAACMAAVCALVTGCSSETEEPEGIVYDAGEWVIDGTTVWLYKGTARDVHIPAGVTVIGRRAFDFRNEVVESVTIPAGVTIIDDYAFYGCTKLASVEIPESVAMIGMCAFQECKSLTDVQIPGSVKAIEDSAFDSCNNLTSVTISEGVTSIGDQAFWGCTSLTDVTIPDGVTEIGQQAFYECTSLDTVTYGGTKEEWERIKKESYIYSKNTKITGKDGNTFTVNANGEITD